MSGLLNLSNLIQWNYRLEEPTAKPPALGLGAFLLGTPMHDETESQEHHWLAGCFGSAGYQVHQVIPDDLDALTTDSAEATAERQQDSAFVRSAMQHLTDRQADVIELRYGIGRGRDYTQAEVAEMLGITQPMVYKHEQAALAKMRKILANVF